MNRGQDSSAGGKMTVQKNVFQVTGVIPATPMIDAPALKTHYKEVFS